MFHLGCEKKGESRCIVGEGIVVARARANVTVAGRNCWALFDGGARNTYVIQELIPLLPTFELEKEEPVSLGGGSQGDEGLSVSLSC